MAVRIPKFFFIRFSYGPGPRQMQENGAWNIQLLVEAVAHGRFQENFREVKV
jgi:hypothetical protein